VKGSIREPKREFITNLRLSGEENPTEGEELVSCWAGREGGTETLSMLFPAVKSEARTESDEVREMIRKLLLG